MPKTKKIILILTLSFFLINLFTPVALAQEIIGKDLYESINKSLDIFKTSSGYKSSAEDVPPENLIASIIGLALSFLGIIFIVLMIYGGFMWMTAGGNEEKVKKARTLIGQAMVGLLIVVAAYAITYIVTQALSEATGAT